MVTLTVLSLVTCLVLQGSFHEVASSRSYSWDTRRRVGAWGAESGVASCFSGHSQLLTEASQKAVKCKGKVSFTLTKKHDDEDPWRGRGPCAPCGSWWQNRRAKSRAGRFPNGQPYSGEAVWNAEPIPERGTSTLLPALPSFSPPACLLSREHRLRLPAGSP